MHPVTLPAGRLVYVCASRAPSTHPLRPTQLERTLSHPHPLARSRPQPGRRATRSLARAGPRRGCNRAGAAFIEPQPPSIAALLPPATRQVCGRGPAGCLSRSPASPNRRAPPPRPALGLGPVSAQSRREADAARGLAGPRPVWVSESSHPTPSTRSAPRAPDPSLSESSASALSRGRCRAFTRPF